MNTAHTSEQGAEIFAQRERDWRNGAIVYQVLVDRFVPSAQLDAKRGLYPAPKVLRDWSEVPLPGTYLEDISSTWLPMCMHAA